MKLYYLPGACPLAAHIILEWIGKPYELQLVTRAEIKEHAYLSLNPAGSVPVLRGGDFTLTQSAAIVEYLAELAPAAGLSGANVTQRCETRRGLGLYQFELHRTL